MGYFFVTYREFATHFKPEVVYLWALCYFLSHYRVLNYSFLGINQNFKKCVFSSWRYWRFYLRHIQRIPATSPNKDIFFRHFFFLILSFQTKPDTLSHLKELELYTFYVISSKKYQFSVHDENFSLYVTLILKPASLKIASLWLFFSFTHRFPKGRVKASYPTLSLVESFI